MYKNVEVHMKKLLAITCLMLFCNLAHSAQCPDLLKFVKRKLNSQETVNMCDAYAGKTVLFVNTASYCGFTPQFKGLEDLYSKYKDQGLMVLGFPSHDFNQEDKDEGKTAELCELTYGVEFPMFEAMPVRGRDADPLYKMLAKKSGTTVKWNFYKYLMDKNGNLVNTYASSTKPTDPQFISTIEDTLKR
ncbi:glutathione peroxidase [Glaciecola sp. 4H-3-7+YE-5]|jgi:glutathione peroxidase|uniref:Glutathione peroxidase n=3 Tax=Paraglaciecola chathamensis TaxID=368405 RepID=A0A8H9LWM4_9ALTE|nr:glutathione peroxidase [Glaciecola sp. 4H-3-7+YE-5]GGZ64120.1 glutathione peroxidase [Paraglaciecola oceanifecundans]|tara:strand:- start:17424 stop:17990 length:567 start_codon:yes stop_codon:yes gene_type:complete